MISPNQPILNLVPHRISFKAAFKYNRPQLFIVEKVQDNIQCMRYKHQKVSNLPEKTTQRKKLLRKADQISARGSDYHLTQEVKALRTNAKKCQRYDDLGEAAVGPVDSRLLLVGNYLLLVLHQLSEFVQRDHVEYGQYYDRKEAFEQSQDNRVGFESEGVAELCECPEGS